MESYVRNFLARSAHENARSVAYHAFKVSSDGTVVFCAQKKPSPIPIECKPYTRSELEAVFDMGCLFRSHEGWLHEKHRTSPIPNGVVICCANAGLLSPDGAMARAYHRLEARGHYPPAVTEEIDGAMHCHWIPRAEIVDEALKEASPRLPVDAIQEVLDALLKRGTVEKMESGDVIHRRVAKELVGLGQMIRNEETGRLSYRA